MLIADFIEGTILKLDSKYFDILKEKLIGEYINFTFIDDNLIYKEVFCEKLVDYFVKVNLKSHNTFSDILIKYVSDIDDVVKRYIPKEPSAKKGEELPPTPRSTRYYKYATEIKGSRNLTMKQIEEYSRVVFCLYMSVIKSGMKEINNFDFSSEGLNLDKIIHALKTEKAGIALPIGKKTLFNLEDPYCTDTATFVITMIMICFIKNNEVEGDY